MTKLCQRCEHEREHGENDYICKRCRFYSDHKFRQDGHTVSFCVGDGGSLFVNVNCPHLGDKDAHCYIGESYLTPECFVAHEMHESGNAMELLTDPYNGDYEIQGPETPIEWYYNASGPDHYGEYDSEFGWRIADDFESDLPAQVTSDGKATASPFQESSTGPLQL